MSSIGEITKLGRGLEQGAAAAESLPKTGQRRPRSPSDNPKRDSKRARKESPSPSTRLQWRFWSRATKRFPLSLGNPSSGNFALDERIASLVDTIITNNAVDLPRSRSPHHYATRLEESNPLLREGCLYVAVGDRLVKPDEMKYVSPTIRNLAFRIIVANQKKPYIWPEFEGVSHQAKSRIDYTQPFTHTDGSQRPDLSLDEYRALFPIDSKDESGKIPPICSLLHHCIPDRGSGKTSIDAFYQLPFISYKPQFAEGSDVSTTSYGLVNNITVEDFPKGTPVVRGLTPDGRPFLAMHTHLRSIRRQEYTKQAVIVMQLPDTRSQDVAVHGPQSFTQCFYCEPGSTSLTLPHRLGDSFLVTDFFQGKSVYHPSNGTALELAKPLSTTSTRLTGCVLS